MGQSDAEDRFVRANQFYVNGQYAEALAVLSELDYEFPGNVSLLKAKARTLAKLGQVREAIEVCDRLESELGYTNAQRFRRLLEAQLHRNLPEIAFDPDSADNLNDDSPAVEMTEMPRTDDDVAGKKKRFRIKPVRLVLFILIIAGMYSGYVNYWVGGGLIAAYFILKFALKFAFGKAIVALFSIPFKMKGKALDGATAELHGIEWTNKPAGEIEEDDDEEPKKNNKPLRYAWLDVTITPPVRTQGFTHWEPGELMVAPSTAKIRKLDDMDKCFRIHDIKYLVDGHVIEDEGHKIHGPQRLKLLAEFPQDADALKFFYYGYGFGNIPL